MSAVSESLMIKPPAWVLEIGSGGDGSAEPESQRFAKRWSRVIERLQLHGPLTYRSPEEELNRLYNLIKMVFDERVVYLAGKYSTYALGYGTVKGAPHFFTTCPYGEFETKIKRFIDLVPNLSASFPNFMGPNSIFIKLNNNNNSGIKYFGISVKQGCEQELHWTQILMKYGSPLQRNIMWKVSSGGADSSDWQTVDTKDCLLGSAKIPKEWCTTLGTNNPFRKRRKTSSQCEPNENEDAMYLKSFLKELFEFDVEAEVPGLALLSAGLINSEPYWRIISDELHFRIRGFRLLRAAPSTVRRLVPTSSQLFTDVTYGPDWDCLPSVVLTLIFENLSCPDLLNVSRVSKYWNIACRLVQKNYHNTAHLLVLNPRKYAHGDLWDWEYQQPLTLCEHRLYIRWPLKTTNLNQLRKLVIQDWLTCPDKALLITKLSVVPLKVLILTAQKPCTGKKLFLHPLFVGPANIILETSSNSVLSHTLRTLVVHLHSELDCSVVLKQFQMCTKLEVLSIRLMTCHSPFCDQIYPEHKQGASRSSAAVEEREDYSSVMNNLLHANKLSLKKLDINDFIFNLKRNCTKPIELPKLELLCCYVRWHYEGFIFPTQCVVCFDRYNRAAYGSVDILCPRHDQSSDEYTCSPAGCTRCVSKCKLPSTPMI